MKKIFFAVVCSFLLVFLTTCTLATGSASSNPQVTGMSFTASSLTVSIGETGAATLSITPTEATAYAAVTYETSNTDVVSLSSPTANGVTVTGLKAGSVVVIAKCQGFTAYCDVTVSGTVQIVNPYIVTPYTAVEIVRGNKKSISVSLYGGSAADNGGFNWSISDSSIATIDTSSNTVVISGIKTGNTYVTVKHSKAKYEQKILIYVLDYNETVQYITSNYNIVTESLSDGAKTIDFSLYGGTDADNTNFSYAITDGLDVLSITHNNASCTFTPKKSGTAIITVTHPKATYSFDVKVFITTDSTVSYIETDTSFVILSGTEGKMVNASFIGQSSSTVNSSYSYTVADAGLINVQQVENSFYVTGIKSGTTKLTIANTQCKYSREVLVVVQDQAENYTLNEKYITTSQNILQLEVGQSAATLQMLLIGGSEADKNNFAWTVDDSSIIGVDSSDGKVTYTRAVTTAAVTTETYMASALVTPKSAGTTKITLTHPKCAVGTTVIVKVYPKGTFASNPIVLANATPLTKVVTGSSTDVTLTVSSGAASDIGTLTWETGATGIATVAGSALAGSVSGISSGSTTLTVKGDNLYRPYTGTVLVGSASELANAKTIYVDNQYVNITSKQTSYIKIRSNNDALDSSITFSATCDNTNVAYVRMVGATLIVQGLDVGTATVTVSNTAAPNTVQIAITVEASDVSIDYPYYLTGDNFIGVVKGATGTYTVDLVNAPVAESNTIVWSCADSAIATIAGNGTQCKITALANGQTTITAKHSKALDGKKVIVYVASTQAELDAMYVMTVDKQNYLMAIGGKEFIKLTTNGTEAQKSGITWSVDDASVVSLDDNYDSGYITAVAAGNATITIKHANANDLKIYVSVSANQTDSTTKSIAVPSIIEMVVGDNRTITPTTSGMTYDEKNAITWAIKDTAIASLSDAGDSAYVFAKKTGQTYLTVSYAPLNFKKDVLLVCADSAAALSTTYVMALEKTFMSVTTGDVKNLSLVFGSAGFPEAEKPNITWTCTSNNVLSLYGNGATAQFVANNPGVAVITVTDSLCSTPVTLKVEVTDSTGVAISDAYSFSAVSMKGVVVGNTETISAVLYDGSGNAVTSGLSSIQWAIDDPTIAGISANEGDCRVQALKSGQTYLTISHPKVAEKKRILIYVAATAAELTSMYPLSAEKTNYLITVGQTVTLDVGTIDNDTTKAAQIKWSVSDSGFISYVMNGSKQMTITGLTEGNIVITVKHPNSANDLHFYVSVIKDTSSTTTQTMITESIIGMVYKGNRTTTVSTNLSDYEKSQIQWTSQDTNIVQVAGTQEGGYLFASGIGETTVTVSYGTNLKRIIRVYVCGTQAEVDAYCTMNIDNNYRKIAVGDELTTEPFFAAKSPTSIYATQWIDTTGNGAASCTVSNGKATFKGVNEGIAIYKVLNPSCTAIVYFYIEVSKKINAAPVTESSDIVYLTTNKNYHVVELNGTDTLSFDVVGNNFTAYTSFEWINNNPDIVTLTDNGMSATIVAKKEGVATITVTNPQCSNMITYTIKVGDKYTVTNGTDPYIYCASTVITLKSLSDIQKITPEVRNLASYSISDFSYTVAAQSVVGITETKGSTYGLTFTPKNEGHIQIIIAHKLTSKTLTIDVVVDFSTPEANCVYLTTSQNFTIIKKGNIKQLEVNLVNYTESDSDNFIWTVKNSNVAYVVGSGNIVQIYGVNVGETTITVTHPKALYELTIVLKVVEATESDSSACYITSSKNVIETSVSSALTSTSINLIGSTTTDKITWSVDDPTILSVIGNGASAYYRGLKEGITSVSVSHPSSAYDYRIVVVVSATTKTGYSLSTTTPLVYMKPGQTSQYLSVSLVNGSTSDNNNFTWAIYSQNVTDSEMALKGGTVITMVGNGTSCVINAVNAGIAVIRVTHPKTDQKLDITIYVSQYDALSFDEKDASVTVGDTEFVSVNVPTYNSTNENVYYKSDNAGICTVYGTNKVCVVNGIKAGTATVTATLDSGATAQLNVNVKAADAASSYKIVTAQTSYLFNPRSNSTTINATLTGSDATDADNENLQWTVQDSSLLSMYPTNGKGAQLQITPTGKTGSTCITIAHPKTSVKKTIYVLVKELDNLLTLDKLVGTVDVGESINLNATIANGKTSDYDNIVWTASKQSLQDGTTKSLVRIIGTGQSVNILGLSAGITNVTCYYAGILCQCTITVEEQNVFSFATKKITIIPGVENTTNIYYDIKPSDSNISFTSTDSAITYNGSGSSGSPSFDYTNIQSEKCISVTATKEGTGTITGRSGTMYDTIQLTFAYNYDLSSTQNKYNTILFENERSITIPYTVYPAITYVGVTPLTCRIAGTTANISNYITYVVNQPDKLTGKGTVVITANKEFTFENGTPSFSLVQYKDASLLQTTGKVLNYYLDAHYQNQDFSAYFVKHLGRYSNTKQNYVANGSAPKGTIEDYSSFSASDKLSADNYLYLSDGESHYILFSDANALSSNTIKETATKTIGKFSAPYNVTFKTTTITLDNGMYGIKLDCGTDYEDLSRVAFKNKYGYTVTKTSSTDMVVHFDATDLLHTNSDSAGWTYAQYYVFSGPSGTGSYQGDRQWNGADPYNQWGAFNPSASITLWQNQGWSVTTYAAPQQQTVTSDLIASYTSSRYLYYRSPESSDVGNKVTTNKYAYELTKNASYNVSADAPAISSLMKSTTFAVGTSGITLSLDKNTWKTGDGYQNSTFNPYATGTFAFKAASDVAYDWNSGVSGSFSLLYQTSITQYTVQKKSVGSQYQGYISAFGDVSDTGVTTSYGQVKTKSFTASNTYEKYITNNNYNITVTASPDTDASGNQIFRTKSDFFGKGYYFEKVMTEGNQYSLYPTNSVNSYSSLGNGTNDYAIVITYVNYAGETKTVSIPVVLQVRGCNINYDPNMNTVTQYYK